jgi:hypothetical protein
MAIIIESVIGPDSTTEKATDAAYPSFDQVIPSTATVLSKQAQDIQAVSSVVSEICVGPSRIRS